MCILSLAIKGARNTYKALKPYEYVPSILHSLCLLGQLISIREASLVAKRWKGHWSIYAIPRRQGIMLDQGAVAYAALPSVKAVASLTNRLLPLIQTAKR